MTTKISRRTTPARGPRRASGFTLVELIIVMLLLATLLGLVAPSLLSGGGPKLRNSANLLVGQLVKAQQLALRDRRPAEVRFYALDPKDRAALIESAFRGYQIYRRNPDGLFVAESELTIMADPIIISPDESLTSFASLELQPAGDDFPVAGGGQYIAFRFSGDGSTNLGKRSDDYWFLTLVSETDFAGKGALPPDFITIQIDPVSGKIRTFQPE